MHPQFFEAVFTIFLATSLAIHTLLNGRRGRRQSLFVALIGSILFWSSGVAMSRTVTSPGLIGIASHISFLGIFALPPVWFALALQLTRRGSALLTPRRFALLFAPSVLSLLAMSTNAWHGFFIRDPSALVSKGPLDWAGPIFWVWTAWSYSLVFAGSLRYLAWSWHLVNSAARWRGVLVCVASLLPLSGNFFHLAGGTAPGHDLTPLLLGFATVMLFVADWRFRLLDTLPIARRDLIEQLHDGVIVADPGGVILDMNPAAERMVGAPRSEMLGRPIVSAVAARASDVIDIDKAGFNRAVIEMCTNANGFETVVENLSGRHYEVRGAAVKDSSGEISGLYLTMRDVTERDRFEEVQRDSRRAQTIASLAAGITHEVNNPLTYVRANISHVICGLSEAAEKGDDSIEEWQSVLEEALEGADRISQIVERVRRFTDTRGGRRETIRIARILEEASRMRTRSPGPQIEITTHAEADLGPAVGSHDDLLEAILNLLDNAQRALEQTGGVIRLSARRAGNAIRIEVEDDGPGVPEALRKQIFEPFFTTGKDEVGSGLGLAITAKLISDFGGTLSFEPVPTGGARFLIELPHGSQDLEIASEAGHE